MTDSTDIMNQSMGSIQSNTRPAQLDYILLDSSGSMVSKRAECLDAIDNYAEQLAAENINSQIVLCSFTSDFGSAMRYDKVRECAPVQWTPLRTDDSLNLGSGGTPLYDAINYMARDIRNRLPIKCVTYIYTDGEDTGSQTNVTQAKAMLDWMRSMGYQVIFIGCDFENSKQAKLLGADSANSVGVSAKRLIDATSLMAEKRKYYSQFGAEMKMSDDEKKEIGGFLADHSGGK